MAGKKISQDLRVTPELTIPCERELLVNVKNKGSLIMIMSTEMANSSIVVCQATGDADTHIVKTGNGLGHKYEYLSCGGHTIH